MKIPTSFRPNKTWLKVENLPFLILAVLCVVSLLARLVLIL